jgi:hypothetical protein
VADFTAFLSSRLSTPDRKPAKGVLSWEGLEVSPTGQHVDRLVFIDHIAAFASVGRREAGHIYDAHVSLLLRGQIKLPGITAAVAQKGLSHIVTVERTPMGTPLPQEDTANDGGEQTATKDHWPVKYIFDANGRARTQIVPLAVGERLPDGTTFAGVSPDTGKPMYTTLKDAPLTYTFNQAKAYAATIDAHGHKDWRLPTKAELNVLFNNHTVIGGFNGSGSSPSGWYWSSTEHQSYAGNAWIERFSDGHRNWRWKGNDASVRPVRG